MKGTIWRPRPDPTGMGRSPRKLMYVLSLHATKPDVVMCCTVGVDGRLNRNSRTNFHKNVLQELYVQVEPAPAVQGEE